MAALGTTMREQVFSKSALIQISSPAKGRTQTLGMSGVSYWFSHSQFRSQQSSPSQKPFLSIWALTDTRPSGMNIHDTFFSFLAATGDCRERERSHAGPILSFPPSSLPSFPFCNQPSNSPGVQNPPQPVSISGIIQKSLIPPLIPLSPDLIKDA